MNCWIAIRLETTNLDASLNDFGGWDTHTKSIGMQNAVCILDFLKTKLDPSLLTGIIVFFSYTVPLRNCRICTNHKGFKQLLRIT